MRSDDDDDDGDDCPGEVHLLTMGRTPAQPCERRSQSLLWSSSWASVSRRG